jgi:hypothetical protein
MASLTTTDTLSNLMADWKIKTDVVGALEELGVETPSDILELDAEDVEEFISDVSLKKIEAKRFRNAYNVMVAAAAALPQGETKDDSTHCLPIAPLVPSVQGVNTDDLPIAVTAVLVSSNINSSSSFEDNEKLIRDQLEREHRTQLAEKDAQIQRLQALASASSSAGETKASVRIDCFLFCVFLSIILCLS